ncbi:MAG: ABC transporter ATP-binding protein [Cyclobacteriaceae bacterium]|nr:ABC transporter ATP-binding protein [Cyclobacteriaceae bacterium]
MYFLSVQKVSKRHEKGPVLKNVSLTLLENQKLAIAGETGSGKTTLLRIIAGLEQPDSGEVLFQNEKVIGPHNTLVPGHPHIAYLPQHFELQKSLRVEQILAYSNNLSSRQASKLFGLCRIGKLLKRKTNELSGGEKQRIALCRLLIGSPKLLLLDEPFSNLDRIVKTTLKEVLDEIRKSLSISVILVSHDPDDTLPWADEIIVLKSGKIVQKGTAYEMYEKPVNKYVAGLFGSYTVITPALCKAFKLRTSKKLRIMRPHHFAIAHKAGIKGIVKNISYFGTHVEYTVSKGKEEIVLRSEIAHGVATGSTIFCKVLHW